MDLKQIVPERKMHIPHENLYFGRQPSKPQSHPAGSIRHYLTRFHGTRG